MQENEYMTIRTAIEGARNTYQTDQHVSCTKCDKLEKTLAKQGHTLKKLKCIQYAFLAMAFVFLLATIGILIYELELLGRMNTLEHALAGEGWSTWSSWSGWSSCSSTCGPGLSQRKRSCDKPNSPLNGHGLECNGDFIDIKICEATTCAAGDGWSTWSSWSGWSSCSSTCGPGLSQRKRSCDKPNSPLNGHGLDCNGDFIDIKICEATTCAVNGDWSLWSSWSSCSSTCGPGLSKRQRYCTKPIPGFGGRNCNGDSTDKRLCETTTCAANHSNLLVNGGWSSWASWSSCSSTCGPGLSQRQRNCTNATPAAFRRSCIGDSTDKRFCETTTCAVNGGWSSWTSWSSCSSTCGPGLSQRQRSCNNPTPADLGRSCIGDSTDKQLCETSTCPAEAPAVNPAFTVYDPRPGRSSRDIRFTMVISNIGGHYNTTTGEYTCHVSGLYYFVLHILKNNRSSSAYCYIRKNRTGFVSALTNPDRSTESGYNGASNSMIVQLDRGDIIDTYCSDFNTLFTGSATSFSGFLLKAD